MALDIDLSSGVQLVFNTPILVGTMKNAAAVNEGLRRAILAAESRDQGVQVSNIGGWQSAPTLLDWPVPEIATLKEWIDQAVVRLSSLPASAPVKVEYTAYGWANVNRRGDYNQLHNHGEDHWAVVYYVSCGEPEPSHRMNGKFELRDPRPGASAASLGKYPGFTFGQAIMIDPEPGMLLAFPAWLDHGVHPFFGKGERISIATNVRLTSIERPPSEQQDSPVPEPRR